MIKLQNKNYRYFITTKPIDQLNYFPLAKLLETVIITAATNVVNDLTEHKKNYYKDILKDNLINYYYNIKNIYNCTENINRISNKLRIGHPIVRRKKLEDYLCNFGQACDNSVGGVIHNAAISSYFNNANQITLHIDYLTLYLKNSSSFISFIILPIVKRENVKSYLQAVLNSKFAEANSYVKIFVNQTILDQLKGNTIISKITDKALKYLLENDYPLFLVDDIDSIISSNNTDNVIYKRKNDLQKLMTYNFKASLHYFLNENSSVTY